MKNRMERVRELMRLTGITEEPFGQYYADTKPEGAFGPKEGAEISRELEERNALDMGEIFKQFSCFLGNVWLARKKHCLAFISRREYGCVGGGFYAGFYPKNLKFIEHYVSTGWPGTDMRGERYLPSPEAMRAFLQELSPVPAPAAYCIAGPLSLVEEVEKKQPDFVTFFARMESMSGLGTLAYYATGDIDAVALRFGSACSHMLSWPRAYQALGKERAVLGTFDPSARKFLKTDEMMLTIPLAMLDAMLDAMPESLLTGDTWETVLKKVARSNKAWEKA